jgi:chitodextrinase
MASGDDGNVGRAAAYDIRAAESPLDSAGFANAPMRWVAPGRGEAGSRDSLLLHGMEYGRTYWIGAVAIDPAGLRSPLSVAFQVTPVDVPPDPVQSLVIGHHSESRILIWWRASGADGSLGIPLLYHVRAAPGAMDSAAFENAPLRWEVPARVESGSLESASLTGLTAGSFTLALRAVDSTGHVSTLSNPVTFQHAMVAPARVVELALEAKNDTTVHLRWTASGDNARVGRVATNHLHAAEASLTEATFAAAPLRWTLPATTSGGNYERVALKDVPKGRRWYFAVMAEDSAGNRSSLSLSLSVTTTQTPPAMVQGLTLLEIGPQAALVRWLPTGDDGTIGRPSHYEIAAATAPLDSAGFVVAAFQWQVLPSGGGYETAALSGLEPDRRYWVAVVAVDRSGNRSRVSANLVLDTTTPIHAPSAVRDLAALALGAGRRLLTWTAVPLADGATSPALYRVRAATAPISDATFETAERGWDVAARARPGTAESVEIEGLEETRRWWIAVAAVGPDGVRSAISNLVEIDPALVAPGLAIARQPSPVPVKLAWRLSAPPPAGGIGIAIVDLHGRLTARVPLGAGVEGQAFWDGRDRHGQPVAAGVYYAALEDGATRHVRKIVLIP